MPKTFLGKGWSFPIEAAVEMAEYEESVRQSVWMILGTAKGERVMRPDFGCGIHHLVFEMNSASTAGKVAQEVKDALLLYEPRIDVRDIQVQPGNDSCLLLINIEYEVRATNNMFNLVYPFYLERSTS
jgi:uncharacterized protein